MGDFVIDLLQNIWDCDYHQFALEELYVIALFYMFYVLYWGHCAFYEILLIAKNRIALSSNYLVVVT